MKKWRGKSIINVGTIVKIDVGTLVHQKAIIREKENTIAKLIASNTTGRKASPSILLAVEQLVPIFWEKPGLDRGSDFSCSNLWINQIIFRVEFFFGNSIEDFEGLILAIFFKTGRNIGINIQSEPIKPMGSVSWLKHALSFNYIAF